MGRVGKKIIEGLTEALQCVEAGLFDDLPVQRAPTRIRTDKHVLERCELCSGGGEIFRYQDRHLSQVKCRPCNGAGWVIHPIGDR